MIADLTILYYTANRIHLSFARAVRQALYDATHGFYPIVSVSHQPILFGENVCVGAHEPSIWQVYQNILTGAKAATTPFVACCEDDSLYAPDHFAYRPPLDAFGYNLNRWVITRRLSEDGTRREAFYYWRQRTQMAQCIAPRQLLIDTLEARFAKYPEPVPHDVAKKTGWGEPGRYERNLGLPLVKLEHFRTAFPNVTFNHSESLMGRRRVNPDDQLTDTLEPWGPAQALWDRIHG